MLIKIIELTEETIKYDRFSFNISDDTNLKLSSNLGKDQVILYNCVNISDTNEYPTIVLIESRDDILLLGGSTNYLLEKHTGRSKIYFVNNRDFEFQEYFVDELVEFEDGIIYIYETGLMLFDNNLRVIWFRAKFIDDLYRNKTNDALLFENMSDGRFFYVDWKRGNILESEVNDNNVSN